MSGLCGSQHRTATDRSFARKQLDQPADQAALADAAAAREGDHAALFRGWPRRSPCGSRPSVWPRAASVSSRARARRSLLAKAADEIVRFRLGRSFLQEADDFRNRGSRSEDGPHAER